MIDLARIGSVSMRVTPEFCGDLLDTIDLGVLLLDDRNAAIGLNQAAQDLLGVDGVADVRNWPDYFPELGNAARSLVSVTKGQRTASLETLLERHDDKQIPVSLRTLRPYGDSEVRELAADMQDAQDELRRLYEQLRSIAQPLQIVRERVDVAALLREIWDDLTERSQPKGIDIEFHCADEVEAVILADRMKLSQVLRNLLENVIDAALGRSRIQTLLEEAQIEGRPALKIGIQGQGRGISVKSSSRFFGLMFTTKPDGSGIGPAIVQHIVVAHRGIVVVEPESGKSDGASLSITLPRT